MADSIFSHLNDPADHHFSNEPIIPANLKFVVSNLKNFVLVQLSPNNYAMWKSQIIKIFRANGFHCFLDSQSSPPTRFLPNQDGSSSSNPLFSQWILTDQNLAASLCSTISSSILPYVISLESTAAIWSTLESRFQSSNRTTKAEQISVQQGEGEVSHAKHTKRDSLSRTQDSHSHEQREARPSPFFLLPCFRSRDQARPSLPPFGLLPVATPESTPPPPPSSRNREQQDLLVRPTRHQPPPALFEPTSTSSVPADTIVRAVFLLCKPVAPPLAPVGSQQGRTTYTPTSFRLLEIEQDSTLAPPQVDPAPPELQLGRGPDRPKAPLRRLRDRKPGSIQTTSEVLAEPSYH
ncbi:hypothetical protein M5K25_018636 [Dendrobium thyrsiflorum]|uniref:Retrotransposon Copia-like N-terminal domain-containing protein n=1 Tax=Dendrobium thyrsiflorum TaxID=117978 RepID=A0ABD0UIK0_DENTH